MHTGYYDCLAYVCIYHELHKSQQTAICESHVECANGGTCSAPNECSCSEQWTGVNCTERMHAYQFSELHLPHSLQLSVNWDVLMEGHASASTTVRVPLGGKEGVAHRVNESMVLE